MKFAKQKLSLLFYLRDTRDPFWWQISECSLLVQLLSKGTNGSALSYQIWWVLVCISLTRMSLTELSSCSSSEPMDFSGCFSSHLQPSSNSSSSSSSNSSGLRSLSWKRWASNYLKDMARAPFKSRTLEKFLSPLAPSNQYSSTAAQQTRLAACSVCIPVLHYLGSWFPSCWHAWSLPAQLPLIIPRTQEDQDQAASYCEERKQLDSWQPIP